MRILLIHQYFKEEDITGGARFNEMTRVWKEMGHDLTVVAGNLDGQSSKKRKEYKGTFVKYKDQNGIKVWRCHVSEAYNVNFFGRLWAYFSFVFSGTYAGLFKAKGPFDVILVTSPPLFVGIIAVVLSFFRRTPYVFEVRDLWPESAIDTGIIKNKTIIKFSYWFESFVYKHAKLINVLTPAFYKTLNKKKGVSKEKLIMIPNAADFSMADNLHSGFDHEEFRKSLGLEDRFVITYVGAHGVANGLDQVLQTAARLKDTNALFLLIGNGMQKMELVNKSQEMKLENVRFIDPVPKREVLKYVLSSDMGTSVLMRNDTFKTIYSNKTFDYMSCKRPILMAIDGVSRELVEQADAGIYVEPENSTDFETKIRYCMTNPSQLVKQGENGYNYAKENFDRVVLAKKYMSHLNEIVSS